ncbi:Hypothetical_protein [Hexamita inflata]|uniref:Hypothetical_protein n=1 Tax=Hexamita inflata TaxID=28002 RepID=A0AA86V650_9EUKA|nr:Hypothetical protein HINF_LOCUS65611 [Hexamita inflata]
MMVDSTSSFLNDLPTKPSKSNKQKLQFIKQIIKPIILAFIVTVTFNFAIFWGYSKVKNLAPGLPIILQQPYTSRVLGPGYDSYICQNLDYSSRNKINTSIELQFHEQLKEFHFKTSGFVQLNISLDVQNAANVSVYQNNQKIKSSSVSCRSMFCDFRISSNNNAILNLTIFMFDLNLTNCTKSDNLSSKNDIKVYYPTQKVLWGISQNSDVEFIKFDFVYVKIVVEISVVVFISTILIGLSQCV